MVGPFGDWVKYSLEEGTHLVTECDGVRLLSAGRHELLRRVPDALADVFRVGSTAPGARMTFAEICHGRTFHRPSGKALCVDL